MKIPDFINILYGVSYWFPLLLHPKRMTD